MTFQTEQTSRIQKLVPDDVVADLPRLNDSYFSKMGERFQHYFCPFMHTDEPAQMCMGHVVPESYANCRRTRVAQRVDVDSFYGAVAERDFGIHLESRGKTIPDVMLDKRLQKEMRPRFVVGGEEVEYYLDRGAKDPKHTRVLVESAVDGRTTNMVFKKSPDEMIASLNKNWGVVIERDGRLTAMVTVIKAAYLTEFHLQGYHWALSPGGTDIGYWMLGKFFRENRGKHVTDVRKAMKDFFTPYKHMYRPIERFGVGELPRGTLEDEFCGLCLGTSGKPFAQIVYVRIADCCHAVLMPAAENPESAATYYEFLNNDKETLQVSHTCFNREKMCWEISPTSVTAHWPKKHFTFDFE